MENEDSTPPHRRKPSDLKGVLVVTAFATGMLIIPYVIVTPIALFVPEWWDRYKSGFVLFTLAGWSYICCIPIIPFVYVFEKPEASADEKLSFMVGLYCIALLSGGFLILIGYLFGPS